MEQSLQKGWINWRIYLPDLPLVIWMLFIAILIGIFSGLSSTEIIRKFNQGWGVAVGEFALILIPSFTLAAVIDKLRINGSKPITVSLSPVLGAAMICPDTAYASLSPMLKQARLSIAFGAYSGFKLLFPAGPLIVATSLGVQGNQILFYCALIFIPVWVAGLIWARLFEQRMEVAKSESEQIMIPQLLLKLMPFIALILLIALGVFVDFSFNIWLALATNPKGALFIAAGLGLAIVDYEDRRDCVESGIRRTGYLLVVIGMASAFSLFLTEAIPMQEMFVSANGMFALLSLFAVSAFIKLLQGSSMATFATVGPIAAPIVIASGIAPEYAVIAVCLGSFIAILPNDSFYWLIRNNALPPQIYTDLKAMTILGGGAVMQAAVGFLALWVLYMVGV